VVAGGVTVLLSLLFGLVAAQVTGGDMLEGVLEEVEKQGRRSTYSMLLILSIIAGCVVVVGCGSGGWWWWWW